MARHVRTPQTRTTSRELQTQLGCLSGRLSNISGDMLGPHVAEHAIFEGGGVYTHFSSPEMRPPHLPKSRVPEGALDTTRHDVECLVSSLRLDVSKHKRSCVHACSPWVPMRQNTPVLGGGGPRTNFSSPKRQPPHLPKSRCPGCMRTGHDQTWSARRRRGVLTSAPACVVCVPPRGATDGANLTCTSAMATRAEKAASAAAREVATAATRAAASAAAKVAGETAAGPSEDAADTADAATISVAATAAATAMAAAVAAAVSTQLQAAAAVDADKASPEIVRDVHLAPPVASRRGVPARETPSSSRTNFGEFPSSSTRFKPRRKPTARRSEGPKRRVEVKRAIKIGDKEVRESLLSEHAALKRRARYIESLPMFRERDGEACVRAPPKPLHDVPSRGSCGTDCEECLLSTGSCGADDEEYLEVGLPSSGSCGTDDEECEAARGDASASFEGSHRK